MLWSNYFHANMKIILGSASKGRRRVLENAGYEFEVMAADIDEKAIRFRDPRKLTLALAHAKADALIPKIQEPAILITSDQVVFWNGQIREKPANKAQAREYLKGYSIHPAETITSVVATNTLSGKRAEGVDIAKVSFSKIPEEAIDRFITEGDPLTHAGGFCITDSILKKYVAHVDGAEDSVRGLPLEMTRTLIKKVLNK